MIGFKRAGKTTYGKLLAEVLKVPFVDTDDLIQEAYQKKYAEKLKIWEIHQKLKEDAFRELEAQVVFKLNVTHFIIAVGGGTLMNEVNQQHLKTLGQILYLKQSKEDVKKALSLGRVPTFLDQNNFEASFEKMYQKRKPVFEELADYTLDIKNQDSKEILQSLLSYVKEQAIFA